MIGFIVVVVC